MERQQKRDKALIAFLMLLLVPQAAVYGQSDEQDERKTLFDEVRVLVEAGDLRDAQKVGFDDSKIRRRPIEQQCVDGDHPR